MIGKTENFKEKAASENTAIPNKSGKSFTKANSWKTTKTEKESKFSMEIDMKAVSRMAAGMDTEDLSMRMATSTMAISMKAFRREKDFS